MLGTLRQLMSSGSVFGYFLQVLPVAVLAGAIFLAARLLRRHRKPAWGTELLRAAFVCYCTGLFCLVVLPANFWLYVSDGIFLGWWDELLPIFRLGEINLVPSIVKCLRGELALGSWVRTMLVGNVAMFVPLGFFLPFVTAVKHRRALLIAAVLVPLCLEVLQTVFGRSFDVDDLICNFLGIVLGALAALAVRRLKAKSGS